MWPRLDRLVWQLGPIHLQVRAHSAFHVLIAASLVFCMPMALAAGENLNLTVTDNRAPEERDERIQEILKSIQSNYSGLPPVQATVQIITTSPDVQSTKVTTHERGDTTITVTESPRTVHASRLLLVGPNYRLDEIGGSHNTWLFQDGFWTQYEPHLNRVSIRAKEHLPGRFPIDPREIGATSLKEGFTDLLAQSDVVSEAAYQYSIEETELLFEIADGKRKGTRYRCVFDPQKNMVPINVEYQMPDGTKNVIMNIAYTEFREHSAWFPTMCVVTFPKSGGQTMTIRIKHVRFLERIADDAFEFRVPTGTLVTDYLKEETFRKE